MKSSELSELYLQYGHIVLRVCKEILRNESDAQDAMQETFLKFWRYFEKLRNKKELLGNLKRTAVSCSIDLLRSKKRQGKYQEAWFDLRELTNAENAVKKQKEFFDKEIVSLLFRAVRVDQSTLEMAYLYYMEDMTLEEVAAHCKFSRRAVGMKLERFRQQALKYCNNHQITL